MASKPYRESILWWSELRSDCALLLAFHRSRCGLHQSCILQVLQVAAWSREAKRPNKRTGQGAIIDGSINVMSQKCVAPREKTT